MKNPGPSVEEICADPPKSATGNTLPNSGPQSSSIAPVGPLAPAAPQKQPSLDKAHEFGPNMNRYSNVTAGYDSDMTLSEDTPAARAGPAFGHVAVAVELDSGAGKPPADSTCKHGSVAADDGIRTNLGNTKFLMALLSEMWVVHLVVILGGTYGLTFYMPQGYNDVDLWNYSCWWKLGWLLPLPYTLICFFGMTLPFRTPKYLYSKDMPKRRLDNLYILTVTKGDNREAVERAWNAHKHLERLHPAVRVHVLTDEPYTFENINCFTCPKTFTTASSKYKARALEWYRQTMEYTEHDWILHLDEESVIDDESVRRVLDFIF
ncbi:hypothetical protein BDK51DRAFT_51170, partial [Blyttiomyces helicus]